MNCGLDLINHTDTLRIVPIADWQYLIGLCVVGKCNQCNYFNAAAHPNQYEEEQKFHSLAHRPTHVASVDTHDNPHYVRTATLTYT